MSRKERNKMSKGKAIGRLIQIGRPARKRLLNERSFLDWRTQYAFNREPGF